MGIAPDNRAAVRGADLVFLDAGLPEVFDQVFAKTLAKRTHLKSLLTERFLNTWNRLKQPRLVPHGTIFVPRGKLPPYNTFHPEEPVVSVNIVTEYFSCVIEKGSHKQVPRRADLGDPFQGRPPGVPGGTAALLTHTGRNA